MKDFITKINKKWITFFAIIFWIIIWGVVSLIINKEIYLPFPLKTFKVLISTIGTLDFIKTVMFSMLRVIYGFALSCILGILLGFLCGVNKFLMALFNPLIIAIRATPVMSFIIIAIIWFASNNVPIFVCFLMCFPIVFTNISEGVKNVDVKLLEMAKVYNIRRGRLIKNIYIPSLMPYILAGMTTALGIGWKATVAAEVLSHPEYAIGTHLYDAKVYLESAELFAWTIVVIGLSFVFEYVIKTFFRKILTPSKRLKGK